MLNTTSINYFSNLLEQSNTINIEYLIHKNNHHLFDSFNASFFDYFSKLNYNENQNLYAIVLKRLTNTIEILSEINIQDLANLKREEVVEAINKNSFKSASNNGSFYPPDDFMRLMKGIKISMLKCLNMQLNYWDSFDESSGSYLQKDINSIKYMIKNIEKNDYIEKLSNFFSTFQKQLSKLVNNESEYEESLTLLKKMIKDKKMVSFLDIKEVDNIFEKAGIKDNIDNIKPIYIDIHTKLIDKKYINILDSIDFLINQKENSGSTFILNKQLLSNKKECVIFPESFSLKEIISFNDNSLVIKDKNNQYRLISKSSDLVDIVSEVFSDDLKERLKNKPFITKELCRIIKENPDDYKNCLVCVNTFLENEGVLKAEKFDLYDWIKKEKTVDFESLDDHMHNIIKNNNIKKYAHSITSNKYRHLYNQQSYKLLEELYELNFDKKQLQDIVGKKIASFKHSDDFNRALKGILDITSNFELDVVKQRASDLDTDIVFDQDNILVVRIKNFNQSKQLGSSSWCIARNEYYFDSYTSGNCSQYFLYDFSKSSTDNTSMIGFTLEGAGKISAAHEKNDDALSDNIKKDLKKIIIPYIIENDEAYFPDFDYDEHRRNKKKLAISIKKINMI